MARDKHADHREALRRYWSEKRKQLRHPLLSGGSYEDFEAWEAKREAAPMPEPGKPGHWPPLDLPDPPHKVGPGSRGPKT